MHLVFTMLVVGLAASVLLAEALSKPPPGACEGIGWGCNVYGTDAAFFAALFVVPVTLMMLLVGNALIAVVARASRKRAHQGSRAGP